MSAPTHTCTAETCWTEHARDEHGQDRCLARSGSTYCELPLGHWTDGSPHKYTLRLGQSPTQRRRTSAFAAKTATISVATGAVLGVLLTIVTR